MDNIDYTDDIIKYVKNLYPDITVSALHEGNKTKFVVIDYANTLRFTQVAHSIKTNANAEDKVVYLREYIIRKMKIDKILNVK